MAKATIEFDLTNEDDIKDHLACVHSAEMAHFIWELKHNILRKAQKDGFNMAMTIRLIQEHIEDLSFDIDDVV